MGKDSNNMVQFCVQKWHPSTEWFGTAALRKLEAAAKRELETLAPTGQY